MASSDEEAALVERVFLRICSAETDEQLQVILGKFLTPIILKLESPTEGIRKKVLELLTHIKKRVSSQTTVKLPVADLISQYQKSKESPFVCNFSILYIKVGFLRLDGKEKASLAPSLLDCVAGRPEAQQTTFLQLVLVSLEHIEYPKTPGAGADPLKLKERPEVAKVLREVCADMLLLPYHAKQAGEGAEAAPAVPPGLSLAALKRLTLEPPMTSEQVERVKLGVVALFSSGVFPESAVQVALLTAAADPRHRVAGAAEKEVSRVSGSQDWNSAPLVTSLYHVIQGTVTLKGGKSVRPDEKRSPASLAVKLKLFPYLLRSREAANTFPPCVQVVFDSLFGNSTNARLKDLAVQFVHHLTAACDGSRFKFATISSVLLSGMMKLIGQKNEDSKLRAQAYTAVGKLVARSGHVTADSMALLTQLFQDLGREAGDVRLSIQEALSLMAPVFTTVDAQNRKLMENLIMQNIEQPEHQARLLAVQYATTVFAPDHVTSRYMLLLACGDSHEQVYREASGVLRSALKKAEEAASDKVVPGLLPQFTAMVTYIHEQGQTRLKGAQKYVTGRHTLPYNPVTYGEILMYLRQCLAYSAGVLPRMETTAQMQEQSPLIGQYVRDLLTNQERRSPVYQYLGITRQLLDVIGGAPAMFCLLEIVAVAYEHLKDFLASNNYTLEWVTTFLYGGKEDLREFAAKLYALLARQTLSPQQQLAEVRRLRGDVTQQKLETQHGAALALGHLLGDHLATGHHDDEDIVMEDMETEDISDGIKAEVRLFVKTLLPQYSSTMTSPTLRLALVYAVGEMARRGPLPLEGAQNTALTDAMLAVLKQTNENARLRERTALTLAQLCVGDAAHAHRVSILEGLLECGQHKQVDLNNTVGDALVTWSQGVTSPVRRNLWRTREQEYKPPEGAADEVKVLLDRLVEMMTSQNVRHRQAACVWLTALLKNCPQHPAVQTDLSRIQQSFMTLLNENDDVIQDFSSRALSLVFDAAEESVRESLVKDLLASLTGTSNVKKIKLSENSEVFEEGALGKTPEGKSMSTYKELCAIATDLNQPDLIYQFMHLANHQAAWAARRGAAVSVTHLAARASQQLKPHLPHLVPKLYRYQFDPSPKVQAAMTSIWSALVPDTKATVDQYLKAIVGDLLMNLTDRHWRVRESSCSALNDVLRGRALDDVISLLPDLWHTVVLVRDDVKDSVRTAADAALKQLGRATVKLCDPQRGAAGAEATRLSLQALLDHGLTNKLPETRTVALGTLVKVARAAGVLLQPHVCLLVPALLQSLTELEPQAMNYLSLHAADSDKTSEVLDSARVAASKTSPMMEVVNLCVQYVGKEQLKELVPLLVDLIKRGVGLGTKVGCATFVTSLVFHSPRDFDEHAGKLMGGFLTGMTGRNVTVKKSYAAAIGHLVKVARPTSVEKLLARLQEWYFEKEDASLQEACGVCLLAVYNNSPDVLQRHAAQALPLVFIAMHEEKSEDRPAGQKTVWEEVWQGATPGTEAGVRLYLTELLDLGRRALTSQSWTMKAQGAAAMSTAAAQLGPRLQPPHLRHLLDALLAGLPGRTWTGKHHLLTAVRTVCVSCRAALEQERTAQDTPVIDDVIAALLREAGKDTALQYRQEAVLALSTLLEEYSRDQYAALATQLLPVVKATTPPEGDDTGSGEWLEWRVCAVTSLGRAWPAARHAGTQARGRDALHATLCAAARNAPWRLQQAALRTLRVFWDRLAVCDVTDTARAQDEGELLHHLWREQWPAVSAAITDVRYSGLRAAGLGVVQLCVERLAQCDVIAEVLEGALSDVRAALTSLGELSREQPEVQARAEAVLQQLAASFPGK